MKFEVIDTKPPEQELQCLRCNTRFHTDPSIQMNLVLIDNVLLPQCPICKTIEDAPEFKKKAKMNIKDCTQTKDGTPVRIYATYLLNGDHYVDLELHDWKDDIPWDCLRPEIKYVTRDKNGDWFGHIIEPKPIDNVWDTYYFYEVFDLSSVIMPEGPSDWKEAIARRPE
jgi:hypothetical protein